MKMLCCRLAVWGKPRRNGRDLCAVVFVKAGSTAPGFSKYLISLHRLKLISLSQGGTSKKRKVFK